MTEVPSEGDQVVEGICAGQSAGVDEAHEQIADVGAVFSFVEQRVVAVANRRFQQSLTDVMPTPGLCRVARTTAEVAMVFPAFGVDDAA